MKHTKRNTPLAQNRIDYIVFHNKDEAAKLLYNYGFEPPKSPQHLVTAIKELVQKKGRKVIKELIQIHPDKSVILKLNLPKEDNFCGACNNNSYNDEQNYCASCGHSNYTGSGDEATFLSQLNTYNDTELEKYYQGLVDKSNKEPDNKILSQEVQMVWNELRNRKEISKKEEDQPKESSEDFRITKKELLLLGAVFVAGALVGHGIKFNFNNGK